MDEDKKPVYCVAITGSETFDDYEFLKEKCLYYLQEKMKDNTVGILTIKGKDADRLGLKFANELNLQHMEFNGDCDMEEYDYSSSCFMLRFANALIAFWDGESKRTKFMIDAMKEMGMPCRVVMV